MPWLDRLGIALGLLGVLFAGLAAEEPLLAALVVVADVLALTLLALRTRATRHADAESIHERLERIRVISRETATKSPVRK